jgi:protein-tyrosine phosphatase
VLCRKLLADKLGCSIEELAGHGFTVVSAGIAAWPGDDVSPPAAIVAAEYGADLTKHRSRPVNPELLETATDVVAMTRMHALALSMRFPGLGPEPIMLCGPDGDLDDPIGGDIELYRACARVIVSHLERLIAGWIRK